MNWLLSVLLGTLSNQNRDVADAKNGNQKLIFSLFQCSDLTICTERISETSNSRLLLMTSRISALSLLKQCSHQDFALGSPRAPTSEK